MTNSLNVDTMGGAAEKAPNEAGETGGGRDPSDAHAALVTNEIEPPAATATAAAPVVLALALVPESTGKELPTLACRTESKQTTEMITKGPASTDDGKNVDFENGTSSKKLTIVLHGKTKKKTATRPSFNLFLKQAADRAVFLSAISNTPKSSNKATTRHHRHRNAAQSPALPMALSATGPRKKNKNSGNGSSSTGKRKRDPASSVHESASKKQNNNKGGDDGDDDDNNESAIFRHGIVMTNKNGSSGDKGFNHHSHKQEEEEENVSYPPLIHPKKTGSEDKLPHGFSQQRKSKKPHPQGNVVEHPRQTDVLLGRGSAIANTPGNVLFRQLVWDRKEDYRVAPRQTKFHVASKLVDDIRKLHDGRFLEPSTTLTTKSHIVWCEAPLHRAIEKSCQALRELKMKEPAPMVGVPLPTPTLLPPSMGPKKPQAEQTPPLTTTNAPTITATAGPPDSPWKKKKSNKSKNASDRPSKYPKMPPGPRPVIEKPRFNDVLFGRGGQIALHPGNVQFRQIVWQEKDEYQRTRNAGIKRDVAMHVIGLVRELEPPGRFLELAGTSIMEGPWVESTPERILEKTSQALREQKWHWTQKAMATSAAEGMIQLDESLPTSYSDYNEASSFPSSYSDIVSTSAPDDSEQTKKPVAVAITPEAVPPTQQYVGEEVFQDKSQEEQMAMLREGSRIAIYWPLDEVFYPATVDDSLQDNFFYVKYDDGEAEWIDLTRNSFYTLKPLVAPPAPRPKKKATARKTKPKTKPAPKAAKTKPGPKPKPSTSSVPTPPETTSAEISSKPPTKVKPASKAKAKLAPEASAKPAPEVKVKPAPEVKAKPVPEAKAKPASKTSTKAASKTPTKAAATRTSARAASKTPTKAASKIPVKAAKTVAKPSKKEASPKGSCGWVQRNQQIRDGVAKYGKNWKLVATMVPDWSAEACQRRFAIELDPELSRELLTGKEIRQMMRHQSEHGNVWVKLAFKMHGRATSFISEKWGRKIRRVAIEYVQKKTGLKVEKIEDPKTKKINYHGYFEGAYKAVMATHPF